MNKHRSYLGRAVGVLAALAALTASNVEAQQAGTITGQVVASSTGAAVPTAQVFISALEIGALARADGRYLLPNVPAGTHTVEVTRIGYRSVAQQVTVTAGQPVALNFSLSEEALQLDAIVVTGTAGGTQRRAIGNVVSVVDAAARAAIAPISTVNELLSQSTPGVMLFGLNGNLGTGSVVRIRGTSSPRLGTNPILVVDGIRVDNSLQTGPNLRHGSQSSRMNDFDPDDIESIEIIKGPAAATLYGTEASNGVIQIVTKKGVTGAPAFDVSVRQGYNYMDSPAARVMETYWYDDSTGQLVDQVNIFDRYKLNSGGKDIFTYGRIQGYDASLRGGTDIVRYYTSVGFDDEVGIVDYNWQKELSARANIQIVPNETFDISTSLGYVRSETRFAQASNAQDIWSGIAWGHPNNCLSTTECFRYLTPEAAADVDSRQKISRFTGSVSITHNPLPWLTQRLTVGIDYGADVSSKLWLKVPAGEVNFFGSKGAGSKEVDNITRQVNTFDWSASSNFDLTSAWTATTSVGVQYFQRLTESYGSEGTGFPSTAISTVSGGAIRTGSENFLENNTLGSYVQQQFGWNDRAFITAAVRADDNSAFGKDFDAAVYPKLSGAWVVSEEPFWDVDWVSQLRLRSAWGKSGMQPGSFDAITIFEPVTGPGGQGALTPDSKGDPTLKPEVGAEIEIGFDASVMRDRLGIEFTYYQRTTSDALLSRPLRPSSGFLGSQLVNVGETQNWGTELGLNAAVIEGERFGLDLVLSIATQRNEITDLGDIAPRLTDGERNRPGYPISAYFAEIPLSGNLIPGTESVENAMCDGGVGPGNYFMGGVLVPCAGSPSVMFENRQPEPAWYGSQSMTLRFGSSLRFTSVVEFMGGHIGRNLIAGSHRSMDNTFATNPLRDPRLAYHLSGGGNNNIPGQYKAGWAKMRELTLNYVLPDSWGSVAGFSRASINVSWRNAGILWQETEWVYGSHIFDPEKVGQGDEVGIRQPTEIPPSSRIQTTLRVTF